MDGPFITEVELFLDAVDSFASFLEHYNDDHGIDPYNTENIPALFYYHLMKRVRYDVYSVFNLVDSIISDNKKGVFHG